MILVDEYHHVPSVSDHLARYNSYIELNIFFNFEEIEKYLSCNISDADLYRKIIKIWIFSKFIPHGVCPQHNVYIRE